MAKSTALNFSQNLNVKNTTFVNADGTTLKSLYTAAANDAVVKAINVATTDTVNRNLAVWINDGTTDALIGSVLVPLSSGNTGAIASVDILSGTLIPSLPFDATGKRVIPLKAGNILKVGPLVAVTAATTMYVTAIVEEY